jgi:hypothetical protein
MRTVLAIAIVAVVLSGVWVQPGRALVARHGDGEVLGGPLARHGDGEVLGGPLARHGDGELLGAGVG